MEHFERQDKFGKGFSKEQILHLSSKDIEELTVMESPDESAAEKKRREEEIEKRKQKDHRDPNDGGPRPPKEEEFPDDEDEEDDPLSEVSDPNKKED